MITLDDLRLRRDTPTDTLANLKVDAIVPQAAAVMTLIRHAWDDPKFLGQPEFIAQSRFIGQSQFNRGAQKHNFG